MNVPVDPKRTIAELQELRSLTGNEDGAQRVAFTATWAKARAWFREKLQGWRSVTENLAARFPQNRYVRQLTGNAAARAPRVEGKDL